MIIVSKKAQKYFRNLLSKEEIGTQIRVFITNPGTPHAECGVAYCAKDEIEKSDIQLKYEQFCIYINENILVFLKDAKIDLVKDNLNSQLTVQAPYAKHSFFSKKCSLLKDKIKYFLSVEINPQLLMHGGKVNLIEIDENGIAKIQFSGGCNGCSMIGLTLKETIEKKLLASFPEIKEVRDETNHLHGRHSFY